MNVFMTYDLQLKIEPVRKAKRFIVGTTLKVTFYLDSLILTANHVSHCELLRVAHLETF